MKARIPILAALLAVGVSPLHAATITVTSTSDSGPGSLRGALANAGNGDTIDATGIAGTIVLTGGQLVVSNSVSIIGSDPRTLVVNGNLPNTTNRVFLVSSNLIVTITSLTITNGFAYASGNEIPDNFGGGIHNDHSTLTVSNCTLSGNSGGGIYNDGENYGSAILTVVNSTLSGNSVVGGIYNDGYYHGYAALTVSNCTLSGNSSSGVGGGIYNTSQGSGGAMLVVANSILSGNSAFYNGGGICSDGDSSTAAVVSSILSSNSASQDFGGGIENEGAMTVSNTTLSGNTAGYRGGGISSIGLGKHVGVTVLNSTLNGNSGAGIFSLGEDYNYGSGSVYGSAILTVSNSIISGNSGSGIINMGQASFVSATATSIVVNSNISGNLGGGISNVGSGTYGSATLTVLKSTLSGNSGGGGIGNEGANYGSATLTVSNSTLSGNSASSGGGIYNQGYYGNAWSMVANSTFSGNSGGGIVNYVFPYSYTATVAIASTILNASASGASITNITGTVTSLGYNLSSDPAGGDDHSTGPGGLLNATGDIRNTDPMLGPLTDNGGPTFTHALLPCSPAIDQGTSLGLVTDQRGYPRTYDDPSILNAGGGNGTDIGAFEVQSHQSCAFAVTAFHQIGTGKDLRLSYTTVLGSNYVVQTRSNMGSGSWTSLPGNKIGIGVVMQSIVTNGFAAPQGFYRVQQSP